MVDESKSKRARTTLGFLGALASIVSIWWFALRPRRRRREH
ncbi:MAG TPA: hypothetical protein VMV53_09485 [Acidimicrobiales bacterium]|nr:hypothetical protein [Acidimicrobiales bacterium]